MVTFHGILLAAQVMERSYYDHDTCIGNANRRRVNGIVIILRGRCAPGNNGRVSCCQNAFVTGRNNKPVVETRSSIMMGSCAGKNAADPYSASTTDSSQP